MPLTIDLPLFFLECLVDFALILVLFVVFICVFACLFVCLFVILSVFFGAGGLGVLLGF